MKYKVGDKGRVIGKTHGHQFTTNEVVTIIHVNENNKDYQCENGEGDNWWLNETELELIPPPVFSHEDALKGAPVYLDGKQVYPQWNPSSSDWMYASRRYETNGKCRIVPELSLTTILPIEYVEESRWVWVHPAGVTGLMHYTKQTAESQKPLSTNDWQLCEVKIKVPKQ